LQTSEAILPEGLGHWVSKPWLKLLTLRFGKLMPQDEEDESYRKFLETVVRDLKGMRFRTVREAKCKIAARLSSINLEERLPYMEPRRAINLVLNAITVRTYV